MWDAWLSGDHGMGSGDGVGDTQLSEAVGEVLESAVGWKVWG